MPLLALVAFCCVVSGVALPAKADEIRYFGAWSYGENAPRDEISKERVTEDTAAHWALVFDEGGAVVSGRYNGADGNVWLTLRYVEQDGRIYADLYGPDGELITRKSTLLSDRMPRWPEDE